MVLANTLSRNIGAISKTDDEEQVEFNAAKTILTNNISEIYASLADLSVFSLVRLIFRKNLYRHTDILNLANNALQKLRFLFGFKRFFTPEDLLTIYRFLTDKSDLINNPPLPQRRKVGDSCLSLFNYSHQILISYIVNKYICVTFAR